MGLGDKILNNSGCRKPKYLYIRSDCFQRHVLKTICILEYAKFLCQTEHIKLFHAGMQ